MEHGGKHWMLGKRRDLYIMYKLAPETPGTDQGWVYGTVTPGGEVTSAGRVATCMRCHTGESTSDRMFGLDADTLSRPTSPVKRFSTGAKTGGR